MKLQVKESVPVGGYQAVFVGVEITTHEQYGDGLTWEWRINGGQHDGQSVYRTTKTIATAKNSAGRMLCGVTGKSLEAAKELDLDQFRGRAYFVTIGMGESSTRVEAVAAIGNEPF